MTLLQVCQSVHEVVYVYRHRFGFPVEVVADRPLLITGRDMTAVSMPQPLGRVVRDHLVRAGVASVPVITHLKHPRWIFLVGLDRPTDTPSSGMLAAFGVDVVRADKRVWLPHLYASVGWRWESEPHPMSPSGRPAVPVRAELLTTTRAVVEL
ncbi:hypothetical protein [Nocardia cyriacigeorgica]|uniref:DNA-directed RNA polymerase subunit beta n=1 Tax=Nocardia cyriacigeorgica TaxID=135487 RepID=A0A5R8PF82_9NOCA|nr:hypothetical protein [Nocardia cyriacigeorgica]MBF6093961.1 hypothetical protein [Nocardia cyriacigeorgica]TLF72710.1 hypothetical protein FEK34_28655 [Nocardia cyriacigeorgica]TLG12464.1 hypothetical protein FEK35_11190 [Nocardia cyriacigeorgica]